MLINKIKLYGKQTNVIARRLKHFKPVFRSNNQILLAPIFTCYQPQNPTIRLFDTNVE